MPLTPTDFRIAHRRLVLLIVAMLSACAAAPGNQRPDTTQTTPPTQPPAATSSLAAPADMQHLDARLNIQFDWWKLLHSPQLNTLIEQGIAANPTVESMQTALLKAQQSDVVRLGYFHAAASVNEVAGQNKTVLVQSLPALTEAKFIGDAYYGLRTKQLAVAYLPELLRSRTTVPASPKTEMELGQLRLEASYLTFSGNLMACALQDASLRAQMVTARKIVAVEHSLLVIARKRFKAGLVAQDALSVQQASAERAEQALLALTGQFEKNRELLHFLLGIPAEKDLPETFELASLHLSEELPLELPAALIEQRPDVRAAQLEMMPANTKYQDTINFALKNVEDTLLTIYSNTLDLKAASAAGQENLAMLEAVRKRYGMKEADYQEVLTAERNALLATLRLTQASATHLGDAVALYHALGGAWWDEAVALEVAGELTKR